MSIKGILSLILYYVTIITIFNINNAQQLILCFPEISYLAASKLNMYELNRASYWCLHQLMQGCGRLKVQRKILVIQCLYNEKSLKYYIETILQLFLINTTYIMQPLLFHNPATSSLTPLNKKHCELNNTR